MRDETVIALPLAGQKGADHCPIHIFIISNTISMTSSVLNVGLRFNVGSQYVLAKFDGNEDLFDNIQKFFTEEDIPVYLHDSILCAVSNLIIEESLDPFGENYYTKAIEDAKRIAQNAKYIAEIHKKWKEDTANILEVWKYSGIID
jgi:hypothetical protein